MKKVQKIKVRDWSTVIEELNNSKLGWLKIEMGSPGSAQVTRIRLLGEWRYLEARTVGRDLYLNLAYPG